MVFSKRLFIWFLMVVGTPEGFCWWVLLSSEEKYLRIVGSWGGLNSKRTTMICFCWWFVWRIHLFTHYIYPFPRPFIGVITSFTTGTRMGPPCWILFCWWFLTDSTMVNQHEKPPFGRIILGTFSKASEWSKSKGQVPIKPDSSSIDFWRCQTEHGTVVFGWERDRHLWQTIGEKTIQFDILFFGMDWRNHQLVMQSSQPGGGTNQSDSRGEEPKFRSHGWMMRDKVAGRPPTPY